MADMLQFDDAKRIFFGKLTERGRFCLVQMTKSLEEILAAFNHLLASQPT